MNYIILFICSIILPITSLKQMKPKLCINCKYHIPKINDDTGKFGKCSLFKKEEYNSYFLVNGMNDDNENYYYCSVARNANHMCGGEGKYYKKKVVKKKHIK